MSKFNNGKPYHGSEAVDLGKLKGATGETDYFYFFCPKCPNDEIIRILEYGVHAKEPENPYNELCKSKARYGFTLVFRLHCDKCGHTDFVKISNTGWQGGEHGNILARFGG
jgi:predicted nucleic-acid-binding Zn-ribbon protein